MKGWEEIAEAVASSCRGAGLDLCAPFRIGHYNERVDEAARIDDLGDPEHLSLIVGNSGALWGPFVDALRQRAELLESGGPLDAYVVSMVEETLQRLPLECAVRYAHLPAPSHVSVQTAAEQAGLAFRAESGLCVHPTFGPWIALRAIIVVPVFGPDSVPVSESPCNSCKMLCKPAFERAQACAGDTSALKVAEWRKWLAVRDACPIGKEHRYSDEQIRYHYVKDVEMLRGLL